MVHECLGYRSKERITLHWRRGNKIPDMPHVVTRWNVFSLCGKLFGHLPVGGWLRVAVAFTKWRASDITARWDDKIDDAPLNTMSKEVLILPVSIDGSRTPLPAKPGYEPMQQERCSFNGSLTP